MRVFGKEARASRENRSMARQLKTFEAHLGFYDTVVAAPSQAAALKAWGSRQDLFREGFAKVSADPAAIAAASAKPGVVLRRPAGSKAAFSENPGLPEIPKAPPKLPKPAPKPAPKAPPVRPNPQKSAPPKLRIVKETPPPPPPRAPKPVSRRGIEAAEQAIAKVKSDETGALAALEKRKNALAEEERRIRDDFRKRRERAEQKLAEARRAYASALNRR
jgi:hypothetical protein